VRPRLWLYPIVVGLFVVLIAVVIRTGDSLLTPANITGAPAADSSAPPAAAPTTFDTWRDHAAQPLARLILQIVTVVAAARVFGAAVRRLGQPAVIGEMAAGVALGPSFFGAYFPDLFASLFAAASLGTLQLLSQVGVLLFMFVVGLEVNWQHVRRQAHAAVAVSHVSILFPFLLGVLLALSLYTEHAADGISFQAFGLFMGIAMSITAFPVLARILEERRLMETAIGSMALTCAAVDDVTAWTLLAFVVAVVTSGGGLATAGLTLMLAVAFVLLMTLGVRPILARTLSARSGQDPFSKERMAIVLILLFASAWLTEMIGIHALFGAFLAGAIMPADEETRSGFRDRLEGFSAVFLLPLFFAFTGLRTEVGLLDGPAAWLMCFVIVATATVGKLGGSAVTARLMGIDWNSAFILGALMNTRGLMELIALNVGYDLGVISPEVFTALVLMALITTALTGPLVDVALARAGMYARIPTATHGIGRT
jgi:Kef-type K+ transport system membrane component KefB